MVDELTSDDVAKLFKRAAEITRETIDLMGQPVGCINPVAVFTLVLDAIRIEREPIRLTEEIERRLIEHGDETKMEVAGIVTKLIGSIRQ